MDVVSLQHFNLDSTRQALAEIVRVLKPEGTLFSYRLSDRSVITDAGPRIDNVTLSDITVPDMQLAHDGLAAFWSLATTSDMYQRAGSAVERLERFGRTYPNGMLGEYLSIIGVKT